MKPLAIYNVWDGEELLELSIKQTEAVCDILIVYQTESNHGQVNEGLEGYIQSLPYPSIKYTPQKGIHAGRNELNKRQAGLEWAKGKGYDWFMFVDCDEFYYIDELRDAWNFIKDSSYDGSVCSLITYLTPTLRMRAIERYHVPLFCRLKPDTKAGEAMGFTVDPTRKVRCRKAYEFPRDKVMMHHYTMVRKDVSKKLNNSSAKGNWAKRIPKIVNQLKRIKDGDQFTEHYFMVNDTTVIECENHFNVPSW